MGFFMLQLTPTTFGIQPYSCYSLLLGSNCTVEAEMVCFETAEQYQWPIVIREKVLVGNYSAQVLSKIVDFGKCLLKPY